MSTASSAVIGLLFGGGAGGGGAPGPPGPQGEPGLNWKGAYIEGAAYSYRDAVYWQGSSYFCRVETTANAPSNDVDWAILAIKGDVGATWRGPWIADTLYVFGDVVERYGSSWILNGLDESYGPPSPEMGWALVAAAGQDGQDEELAAAISAHNDAGGNAHPLKYMVVNTAVTLSNPERNFILINNAGVVTIDPDNTFPLGTVLNITVGLPGATITIPNQNIVFRGASPRDNDLAAGTPFVFQSRFIGQLIKVDPVNYQLRGVSEPPGQMDNSNRAFFGSKLNQMPTALPKITGGLHLYGGGVTSAGGDGNTPTFNLARWSNDSGGISINVYKSRNAGDYNNIANVAGLDTLLGINCHGYSNGFLGICVGIQAFVATSYTVTDGIIPEGVLHLRVAKGDAASGAPTRGVTVASSAFQPYSDNVASLGASSRRWTDLFVTSGTIQTSDQRAKTVVDFPDEVLDAWAEVSPVFYQMNDSIEAKGEDQARVHAGYISQEIKRAFNQAGIDPFRYGFFCYDEWDATEEVKEKQPVYADTLPEDGGEPEIIGYQEEITQEAAPAGNRYSLRYEQCAVIEAAYQRRRAGRLEQRVTALEERLAALEAKIG